MLFSPSCVTLHHRSPSLKCCQASGPRASPPPPPSPVYLFLPETSADAAAQMTDWTGFRVSHFYPPLLSFLQWLCVCLAWIIGALQPGGELGGREGERMGGGGREGGEQVHLHHPSRILLLSLFTLCDEPKQFLRTEGTLRLRLHRVQLNWIWRCSTDYLWDDGKIRVYST